MNAIAPSATALAVGEGTARQLSVVVPVYNEEGNLEGLLVEIARALNGVVDYEVIYVDDGSTDDTPLRLARLRKAFPRLRVLRLAERCGQSTAIWTGVRAARSSWVVTLDGDGQNDPADIPHLIEQRDLQPYGRVGLIAGWRRHRHDTWMRRISSRIANAVRSRALGDQNSDTGCGLKLFRRDVFLELPCFDHMHRFLPALVQRAGRRVVSVPVRHRPRMAGTSKYGIQDRLWVGIVDLLGVAWLKRRARHPHVEEVN